MSAELVELAEPVAVRVSGEGRSNPALIEDRKSMTCVDSHHEPSLSIGVKETSHSEFNRFPDWVYSHLDLLIEHLTHEVDEALESVVDIDDIGSRVGLPAPSTNGVVRKGSSRWS